VRRAVLLLAAALAAVACSDKKTPPVPPPAAVPRTAEAPRPLGSDAHPNLDGALLEDPRKESHGHEALPERVELSPRVMAAAGIKVAAVRSEALPATVDLTGEVTQDPDRTAQVVVRAAGRILEVRFKEGQRVPAGALLAVVESPELARARAAVTSTDARARAARQNAARLESLAGKSLAGAQEVATASAEAAALDAEAAAARQALAAFGVGAGSRDRGAARLQVRTPIAGYVLRRDGVQGQAVNAGHVLAVVSDLDRAYFVGRLFEKDVGLVRAGVTAEVRLNAFPKVVFPGRVEAVGKQLDPAARTVTARIAIENRDDLLKAGLFGNARVVVSGGEPTAPRLVVPVDAVTQIAGRDVVFVQQQPRVFELHPVTLGRTAGGRAEILAGLRDGERVVVEGVFSLKSAVLKSSFAEEE
jgi:cobalt-zinc-cadmium efflux system membrane fusion protein